MSLGSAELFFCWTFCRFSLHALVITPVPALTGFILFYFFPNIDWMQISRSRPFFKPKQIYSDQ